MRKIEWRLLICLGNKYKLNIKGKKCILCLGAQMLRENHHTHMQYIHTQARAMNSLSHTRKRVNEWVNELHESSVCCHCYSVCEVPDYPKHFSFNVKHLIATHGTTEIRPVEGSRQSLGQNTISNSSRYADNWTTGESRHTDEGIQVPLHRCGSDTSTVLSHHNKGVMHYLNTLFWLETQLWVAS